MRYHCTLSAMLPSPLRPEERKEEEEGGGRRRRCRPRRKKRRERGERWRGEELACLLLRFLARRSEAISKRGGRRREKACRVGAFLLCFFS